MLAKRIIPCLDVTGGRVVKGVNFVELRDAGDPVEIAARYNEQGADELTFLDITATSDQRDLILPIIEAVASQVFIPLTVGGGVRTVEDVRRLLNAGADKVSFNSAAVANPQVIRDASDKYGAQCIVVAIDAKARPGGGWDVYTHGGRKNTGLDAVQWAQRMAEASGCELGIMLETIPLSAALLAVRPDVLDTRLAAATAGDDFQLLFAADPGSANDIRAIAAALNVAVTPIGHAGVGDGIMLTHRAQRIAPPERLGFMH